MTAIIYLS